ncbi:MAG: formate--tetrahydrofolate ligase [Clostridia bacterium]|nr:formate--tetrahydrofolate ligase [Clostridia bacterium]MDY5263545.1 formate--tetrahydrofolate ligase [Eubacteriales bacterium]
MKTDIQIANETKLQNIVEIAKKLNIPEDNVEQYGKYKAKISVDEVNPKGKLILVTAINPTPYGEGKTTVSIGLADGMAKINKNVCLALREPSLGPVFGIKGGATGGGHAQVAPMEDINLHFTGDLHAITSANNLLSAIIDNHLQAGNSLRLDTRKITFKRCVDLNDRALRNIVVGLGGAMQGVPREEGFTITAASEVMAVLCLSSDIVDLKRRLGNIVVGYNVDNQPVYCKDLKAENAMAILLKDALKPNLVQTLEGTPAIIHGGPFANIAHGCNTMLATKTALTYADYVVTEAGFGADLGAEKFFDIKCRKGELEPKAVVLVATIRSLKYNGGANKEDLTKENLEQLRNGLPNLLAHIDNLTTVFNMPVVVALNKFITDTASEIKIVEDACREHNADVVLCEAWEKGGEGAKALAEKVVDVVENSNKKLTFAYDQNDSIVDKITAVATKVYGAGKVIFSDKAKKEIARIEKNGLDKLPVCIAKTQYSFSDNPKLLCRPKDFEFTISDVVVKGGAEFIVCIAGNMMLMPGLPKLPVACNMAIDKNGKIEGLF